MLHQQIVREIAPAEDRRLLCPSAQPEMEGSRIMGVVGGTVEAVQVAYLNEHLAVTDELLASTAPAKPTEVFRSSRVRVDIHLAARFQVEEHPRLREREL